MAFHREAYRPKGGPSGGNGGHGGDVILEADGEKNNLIDQYYSPRLIAEPGKPGLGKGMDGPAGKNLIIKVPCGTVVWEVSKCTPKNELQKKAGEEKQQPVSAHSRPPIPSSHEPRPVLRYQGGARAMEFDLEQEGVGEEGQVESEEGEVMVADLVVPGQRHVICKGGRGGLGNKNFATSRRQAPRFAQPGEYGEEGEFRLELRILADVGLVGYPNAGKSTLLTAISRAHPKIAPYPFTTLNPQIGIVEFEDFTRLTVCDVPGIIEGAHRNVGLGHAFLRHIQRCRALIILLDMAGADGRQPWDDYRKLLGELERYDPGLLEKNRLVVANKMDEAIAKEHLKNFKRRIRKTPVLPISAGFDEGIDAFKEAMKKAAEGDPDPVKGIKLPSY